MDPALLLSVGGAVVAVVVGGGTAAAVAVRRARERRRAGAAPGGVAAAAVPPLTEVEREAGVALVRSDERVRLAADELGFAIAEFGDGAAAQWQPALDRARGRLGEAFRLNQQLNDHVPDTAEQRREWAERIVALCRSADAAVDEQRASFASRRATAQRTPAEVDRLRTEAARIRGSIGGARATLAELAERYSDDALAPIADAPRQADELLDFAERSARVAESRLAAARDEEADAVVRAGAETAQRARGLLVAVDGFEARALQAEATLAAMIAESTAELAEARAIPEQERGGRIDDAITDLQAGMDGAAALTGRRDPIGTLSTLRRANTALGDAVADREQSVQRRARLKSQLVTALDDAERQIDAARALVADHRAPVGPDARTRLAEAERELASVTDEREPEPALARARRAAALAAEAGALARDDVARASARNYGPPADWGYRRRGGGGADVIGGVLGGLAIGGLLDGIGDMGDLFD